MSTGALENICQQKSGRAIALPAPPPPRSLRAQKNTTQLAKYPHVLYAKPSNKV